MKNIFKILLLFIFSNITINNIEAQQMPDCDDMITPPISEDMFIVSSPCDEHGDEIIFTYEDFQASSNDVSDILGIPIDEPIIDPEINQTSAENGIDILSANFGNMSIEELMECFDLLCSPQLANAQGQVIEVADAFGQANDITQQQIDQIISEENSQGNGSATEQEVVDELGGVAIDELGTALSDALNGANLQEILANALGLDPADCTGESVWDDMILEENPFDDPAPGGEFIKSMENKVSEMLMDYIQNNTDLNGDPNWFFR